MLLEDYIQLLEDPMSADEEAIAPLRAMLSYAPYCASAQLLLLRALYSAGQRKETNIQLQKALLYAPPEVSVYFLLREQSRPNTAKRNDRKQTSVKSGDSIQDRQHSLSYFEMIEKMTATAKRTGISMEELTKRLIETRKYVTYDNNRTTERPTGQSR